MEIQYLVFLQWLFLIFGFFCGVEVWHYPGQNREQNLNGAKQEKQNGKSTGRAWQIRTKIRFHSFCKVLKNESDRLFGSS